MTSQDSQPSTLNPKRLLLMRHAKTESPYSLKRDFDRELTDTGIRDAFKMGEWIKARGIRIDRILSSSARRTRQTTEKVMQGSALDPSQVEFMDELYHAGSKTFFETIQAQDDRIETLLIVSHNMGITDFANQLTNARIDHMQPGSIFAVQSNCVHWQEFPKAARSFLFYQQP